MTAIQWHGHLARVDDSRTGETPAPRKHVMYTRKSWREKLADDKDCPKVVEIAGRVR